MNWFLAYWQRRDMCFALEMVEMLVELECDPVLPRPGTSSCEIVWVQSRERQAELLVRGDTFAPESLGT